MLYYIRLNSLFDMDMDCPLIDLRISGRGLPEKTLKTSFVQTDKKKLILMFYNFNQKDCRAKLGKSVIEHVFFCVVGQELAF